VQRLFESRWLRRLETMDGQASFLAQWEALGDWRLGEQYFSRTMSAAATEVTDAARRHLSSSDAAFLVYRPGDGPGVAGSADEARRFLTRSDGRQPPNAEPHTGEPADAESPDAESPDAPPTDAAPRAPLATLERIDGSVFVFRTRRGIPILVRQRPGAPMVHLGLFTAVGSALESDATAGLATVTARAMLKGTERRSAEQVAIESELLGGSIAPSVTADGAGWSISVPVTRVAEAVELLADVTQHPLLADEAIETERAIAMANLAELRDDMYRYPVRLATAAAYPGHPYGRGPLGSESTLAAIRVADARAWHESHVAASPAALAIAGDVDDAEAAALLARAFDSMSGTAAAFVDEPAWPARRAELAEQRDREQTALAMAFPGPARRCVERFAAHLLAAITSGLGGRFFDTLRDARSLAYTVHSHAVERVRAGGFVVYIATSPPQEEAAREGLLAELARLRTDPVTAEELDRAKVYTLGARAIARQSGATVLGELVDAWLFGTGLEELDQFETRVSGVTADAIRALAVRFLDPERRVEGIVRGRS
jgi:zinc protease